jgi:hypothetical protein
VTTVATTAVGGATPARVAAAAVAGCIGLAAWNPGDDGVGLCPTNLLTGLDCPFCGGMRAVASFTRGHPFLAADHNLFVVALAPLAVVWWVAWWLATRRGRPAPRIARPVWVAVALVAIVFTVVRNLDVAGLPHWLAAATST